MTKQDWVEALDDAARVGLLTGLGGGMYRIHPALPGLPGRPSGAARTRETTTR